LPISEMRVLGLKSKFLPDILRHIMYIHSASQQVKASSRMLINGREVKPGGPAEPGPAVPSQVRKTEEKTTIYDNFSREMAQRLEKTGSGQSQDSAQALTHSLTGAMGEIEKLFGREAATMVMARILVGTANGADEASLTSSLSNGLAGLQHSDPTGVKLKQLTKTFNHDLALALDPEAADRKLNDGSTLSLSYALARHFGGFSDLNAAEVKKIAQEEKPGPPPESIYLEENAASTALEPSAASSALPRPASLEITAEIFEMFGFDEAGRWGTVEVTKLDQETAEEVKEMAEYGLAKGKEVHLFKLIEADISGEGKFLDDLATFLEADLGDKESAEFVKEAISKSRELLEKQLQFLEKEYTPYPKLAGILSQVYSKIAAEGEADKLAALENYINNDFKEALNPVLAEYSRTYGDINPDLADLVGEFQFKGLGGVSQGEESDAFSLNWGYKDNSAYDQATAKRFLQEDFQAVKAVKAKADEAEREKTAKEWDQAFQGLRDFSGQGTDGPADPEATSTLMEKFNAERRQEKLAELLDTKFGQLSDSSREELAKYIEDRYSEDEAETLLENIKWNKNLMGGLAALHRDMRALGADEDQMAGFVSFLNDHLKRDVESVASKTDGPAFAGWQAPEDAEGDLTASFTFDGREPLRVHLKAPERTEFFKDDPVISIAQQNLRDALAASTNGRRWSGWLIDQMA